jgi:dihydropteroate synthase
MSRARAARNTPRAGTPLSGPGPVVVGILNVTPDSFSDGGDFLDPEAAALHAAKMLDEGAKIIDLGGESTRPGSEPVSQEEEIRRVVPVLERILAARPEAVISVDTYRSETAATALEAGARMVNDVTALRGDPRMVSAVVGAGCPVILMHMQGEPKTMQREPYYRDVVSEVRDFLARRAEYAVAAGVGPENVILDPGIGFGKNLEHNLALLRNLDAVVNLGFPVLIGASRKRFIEKITSVQEAKERVFGTVATTVLAYEKGVTFFRVHDVRANSEALAVAEAVRGSGTDWTGRVGRGAQEVEWHVRAVHGLGRHAIPHLPPVTRAFLSLGSNLDDRLGYLRAAVNALRRGPRMSVMGTSKVYETVPVEVEVEEEQPDYLNCIVELECGLPAVELLRYCQGIEAALGRENKGEKAPRTLDIDVLLFGDETIAGPDLRVPHAGVTRAFNLRGLADLDVGLYIPERGPAGELLAQAEGGGIRTYGEAEELC